MCKNFQGHTSFYYQCVCNGARSQCKDTFLPLVTTKISVQVYINTFCSTVGENVANRGIVLLRNGKEGGFQATWKPPAYVSGVVLCPDPLLHMEKRV